MPVLYDIVDKKYKHTLKLLEAGQFHICSYKLGKKLIMSFSVETLNFKFLKCSMYQQSSSGTKGKTLPSS